MLVSSLTEFHIFLPPSSDLYSLYTAQGNHYVTSCDELFLLTSNKKNGKKNWKNLRYIMKDIFS